MPININTLIPGHVHALERNITTFFVMVGIDEKYNKHCSKYTQEFMKPIAMLLFQPKQA